MKPFIGMNIGIDSGPPKTVGVDAAVHEAILAVDAIPVLIPALPENDLALLLNKLDGVVLVGGEDYSPALYGQSAHHSVRLMNPERQAFDLMLINQLIKKPNMSVLGLCGGAQLINIAFGGSLVQDIVTALPDSSVSHRDQAKWHDWHVVHFQADTKLADIYKCQSLNVPTAHHQSVDGLGKGLKCSAVADDGVIEALEANDYPFMVGVQWHAERDIVNNRSLFRTFVAQAQVMSNTRRD